MGAEASFRRVRLAARRRVYQPIVTKFSSRARRDIFRSHYINNSWNDSESRSGHGSGAAAQELVRELPSLLRELGIKTLLDVPCGDWAWMRQVDLGETNYVGVDIVPEMIGQLTQTYASPLRRFLCLDAVSDKLPPGDAILSRDFFIHLADDLVWRALRNFKATNATWLLTTTNPDLEANPAFTLTGSFRPLNLQRDPFNFPAPIRTLEEPQLGRVLAVFELRDLPDHPGG